MFGKLFKGVGNFLKGGVQTVLGIGGSALGAHVGAGIDRRAARGMLRDKYNYLEGKGLTPQEISGSGFSAGGTGAAASVLGNQAQVLERQQRELQFQQQERDKDRAIQMRAQDMGLASAQTSARAQMYGADVNASTQRLRVGLDRDVYENVTLPDALRRSVTESPAWKRTQIMASMGVDNIIGTAVAQRFGVNPMDASALESLSPSQFMEMTRMIYGMQSRAFSESSGAGMAVTGAVDGLRAGAATLGRSSSSSGRGR